jgi:hypothetical protein
VAWQGIDMAAWSDRGSWTRGGKALTYVRYDQSGMPFPLVDLYRRSLTDAAQVEASRIPIERIAAPLLLVSGGQDQIWPSQAMSETIVAALKNVPNARVTHLSYPDAGHGVFGAPFDPAKAERARLESLGGTLEATLAARTDGWPKVLQFLEASLSTPAVAAQAVSP